MRYLHYYDTKEIKEVSNTSIHHLALDYEINGNAIRVEDGKPKSTFVDKSL